MGSEYDPVFAADRGSRHDDLSVVRSHFEAAAEPFIRSPWSWLAWSLLLPAVALATDTVWNRFGVRGVVFGWSAAILLGGVLEASIVRHRSGSPRTTLAGWVLRSQANLSLVAVLLSAALVWADRPAMVPGVWLLLLGHSFLVLGGLAFAPFRRAGWIYQLAGVAALWPGQDGLVWFAAGCAFGNLAIAAGVLTARRRRRGIGSRASRER